MITQRPAQALGGDRQGLQGGTKQGRERGEETLFGGNGGYRIEDKKPKPEPSVLRKLAG